MIDPTAETFIVQRQGGRLMVQRVVIDHLTVHYSGALDRNAGLFSEAPRLELVGRFDGGGLFDPGDASPFTERPSLSP